MNEFSLIQSSFDVNRTVYIRGISRTTTTSDIIKHFSIVGDITASDIYHHPINKGIIYIQYKSEDDAKMSCDALNRSELRYHHQYHHHHHYHHYNHHQTSSPLSS